MKSIWDEASGDESNETVHPSCWREQNNLQENGREAEGW